MKRFSLAMLLLAAVLFTQASPVRAQYYGSQVDLLNFIKVKMDSLATLLSQPPPVAVSLSTMFSDLDLIYTHAKTTSNLSTGHMTLPVTAGPCIDGVKAILVTLSWSDYDSGGFTVQPVYASSATDTGVFASFVDTVSVCDTCSMGIGALYNIPPNVSGSYSFWLNNVPGAGYLFLRIYPYGTAGLGCISCEPNFIQGLTATARMVQ